MSEVIRCQQMNPVVGVAGAMMKRRRRQRSSFSQVIRGESNEAEWRKKPERLLGWRREPGRVDKLQYMRATERKDEGEGEKSNTERGKKEEGDIRHNKRLHSAVLHESHLVARGQAQG